MIYIIINIKKMSFWITQPVPQSKNEMINNKPIIDVVTNINALHLPNQFIWCDVDIDTDIDHLYTLLRDHYVEDDNFRFNYTKDFLQWALKSPGYKKEWYLGVRSNINNKLVAFISAIPITVNIYDKQCSMVEINFLCIHKKIRNHRLAPVLIKEITRRVNLDGVGQALYTSGITLPTPISTCHYYHRPLNIKKLIDVNFFQLPNNMTISKMIKRYKLPNTQTVLRRMEQKDCVQIGDLLNNYIKNFNLYMTFTIEEIKYWFYNNIVQCYVVEENNKITDMVSYYTIPTTVLNSKYSNLNVAYLYYYVSTKTPLSQLINDIMVIAYKNNMDVFNCLDIHDNVKFIDILKFSKGSGTLNYYLYNWITQPIHPSKIGIVML